MYEKMLCRAKIGLSERGKVMFGYTRQVSGHDLSLWPEPATAGDGREVVPTKVIGDHSS